MLTACLRSVLNGLLIIAAIHAVRGPQISSAQSATRQVHKELAEGPPPLKPLSNSPINIKMSNDAKIVFETIGKLAGLTMIFDADFPVRRITVELADVTIQQALDVVSLEARAFWKPVTQNIVFVIPDQPQKRRDYEEQVLQTY